MTIIEIRNMSFDEKAKKLFEIINSNQEAKKWFSENMKVVGTNGFTSENFCEMFLAAWMN